LKFFEKDTILWGELPDTDFYKKLISLRKNHEVFWNNNHNIEFMDSLPKGLVGFKRWTKNFTFKIVLNLSGNIQTLDSGLASGTILFIDGFSDKKRISNYGYIVCKENT